MRQKIIYLFVCFSDVHQAIVRKQQGENPAWCYLKIIINSSTFLLSRDTIVPPPSILLAHETEADELTGQSSLK